MCYFRLFFSIFQPLKVMFSYFENILFAICIVLFLTSCRTPLPDPNPEQNQVAPVVRVVKIHNSYEGPAGTIQQDFTRAALSCKRDSDDSGLLVGSNVVNSCSSFTHCMALKGFVSAPNGKYDPEVLGVDFDCHIN